MVNQCGKCKSNIHNRNSPGIMCAGSCRQTYHFTCTQISTAEKNALLTMPNLTWICNDCKTTINSPMKPSITDTIPNMSDMWNLLTELKKSVEFCSQKIDDFEVKLTSVGEKLNKFTEKFNQIDNLQTECDLLKYKIADMEQRSRLNNIEIAGVPEKQNENLIQVLNKIGKVINCPINENEIDAIHRVAQFNYNKNKPKNIIVRFTSRMKKDNFVASARKTKNFKANQLDFVENNLIYVNDHLSPNNKILLRDLKQQALEKKYKFVWVKSCKMFARKDENSPIIIINSAKDISKLK